MIIYSGHSGQDPGHLDKHSKQSKARIRSWRVGSWGLMDYKWTCLNENAKNDVLLVVNLLPPNIQKVTDNL